MPISSVDDGTENGWFWDHIDFSLPSAATVEENDVAILFGEFSSNVSLDSYPSGYAAVPGFAYSSDGEHVAAYKVLDGTEDGTVTITLTGNEQCCGNWVILRGVDTAQLLDVAAGDPEGDFGASPVWSSITPVTDGAWVIAQIGAANDQDETVTWDGALTAIAQTPNDGSFSYGAIAYEEIDPATASGDYSGSSLSSATGWGTKLIALRPQGASATTILPMMMQHHGG